MIEASESSPGVFIKTYGCQMNARDSDAVAAQLASKGYRIVNSANAADVILLNTCSVRDLAEQKAFGKMQNLVAESRRSKPNTVLGFMGCMAQSRGQELIDKLPDVDLVLGTQKFHRAGDYLNEILAGRARRIVDVEEEQGSESTIREHLLNGNSERKSVTAFVSIMQGCNQYCSFCIVPHTRGKERCRTVQDIVDECRELVENGVKEVTLLGQIVNAYGKREIPVIDGKSGFVQLLEAVHEVEGLERIRFTSPHPKYYGDDLVEAYANLPKLCESAHIPLQSGSDRILKSMKRQYTAGRFLEIIEKLRSVKPDMGISTDIIVGFPGETDEDFEDTMRLAEQVQFDNAFIFKYSQRKDTPAATLEGQLPQEVKEGRHQRLLNRINEIGKRRFERFVGKEMEVLVQGPSHKNPDTLEGRTRCNKIVVFEGNEQRHTGELMHIEIQNASSFTLYGSPALKDPHALIS